MKDPLPKTFTLGKDERKWFEFETSDDDGDDDDSLGGGGGSVDVSDMDFIPFRGGTEYIRKFEVVGLRWERYTDDSGTRDWRLHVFFNDVPHTRVYGDDARTIMRALGLPEEPPDGV